MTGRDTITARALYADPYEFVPQFKLWVPTNHLPKVKTHGEAIWNRFRVIPFSVTIPRDEQDKHLREKLRAEWPGILAWAVRGCLAWHRDGLGDPLAVREATGSYRREMDTAVQFVESVCVAEPEQKTKTAALYEWYKLSLQGTGQPPVPAQTFVRTVEAAGFERKHTRDGDVWINMRLGDRRAA